MNNRGATPYDEMHGPTDEEIDAMSSAEASDLISAIFQGGV